MKMSTELENRDKVMEAKMEDVSDKLRLGMAALQSAIGETDWKVTQIPLDDAEKIGEEHLTGIREKVAVQMAEIDEKFATLQAEVGRQEEAINNKLKVVRTHESLRKDILLIALKNNTNSINTPARRHQPSWETSCSKKWML